MIFIKKKNVEGGEEGINDLIFGIFKDQVKFYFFFEILQD